MARPEMAIKRYLSAFFLTIYLILGILGAKFLFRGAIFIVPINRQVEKQKTGDLRLACSPIKFNDFLVENLQFEGN